MESKRLVKYTQAQQLIKQIEDNFPVASIKYQGECFWDAVIAPFCKVSRTTLGEDGRVIDPKDSQSVPIFNDDNIQYIDKGNEFSDHEDLGELLISSTSDASFRDNRIDILVVDAPHDYSRNASNKFYNKNNDGLAKLFPNKRVTYLLPRDQRLLKCPFKRETLLYQRSLLVNGIIDGYGEPVKGLKELLLFMKKNNYPFLKSHDELSGIIKTIVYKANQFSSFFTRFQVKCLLTSGFRGVERMAFILAANKAGVKTIEYQHGVLGPEHFNIDLSKEGNQLLPKYFWVYGEKFRKQISPHYTNIDRFILGGKINLISKRHRDTKKRKITVMQAHTQSNVASFCKKLAVLIKEIDGVEVSLRLHPRSHHLLYKYEKQLENCDVSIKDATLAPIENVLAQSRFVIIEESTVAYEADFFGAIPIVVGSNGFDVFFEEIQSGRFMYAKNIKEVSSIVKDVILHKKIKIKGVSPLVNKKVAIGNIKKSSAFR